MVFSVSSVTNDDSGVTDGGIVDINEGLLKTSCQMDSFLRHSGNESCTALVLAIT
jgi:hypothetical protein